jgi:signal transduction histidine kinase
MSDALRTLSSAYRSAFGRFGLLGSQRRVRDDQPAASGPRGRLFRKYVVLLVALVSFVLLVNAALHSWFTYNENKTAAFRIQQEKAGSAARRIEEFVDEIERQLGWTTAPQWAASPIEQRRFDYFRLLRQVPAITELIQLDEAGKEQLRVSRLTMDVVGSGKDYSQNPGFTEARQHRVWFSPVYFRKESEPYMTLAMAQTGRNAGVTIAEVNLKLIWDVITGLKIGEHGYAYVVDRDGRLIAHPDISLVLRNTDLLTLPQVAATRAEATGARAGPTTMVAKGINGNSVLTAHAAIAPLGWTVFVELPMSEALAPLYGAALRSAALLALALGLAALAALFLARRLTVPIRQLQAGAARIGAGELDRRINIHSGDELEGLAGEFNRMAADLQKSYAELEKKVEERTAELKEALDQQTATAEVLGVINSSPGDLTPVFDAMLQKATKLCEAAHGQLATFEGEQYRTVAACGEPGFVDFVLDRSLVMPGPGTVIARIYGGESTVHIRDVTADENYRPSELVREANKLGGCRTMLGIALRKDNRLLGSIIAYRQEVRPFTDQQIALLRNFGAQAVIAMENARLLTELRARTAELGRSVDELTMLSEVGQAVSSTLDLRAVLSTILTRSVGLTGADAGAVFRYSGAARAFRLVEAVGWDETHARRVRDLSVAEGETVMGEAAARRTPIQIADLTDWPSAPLRDAAVAAGLRSVLIVPLVGPQRVLGVLVLQRRTTGEFPPETVRLMQALASQSVLAIQNARLFREIADKSEQLALASEHKSQFLANMSHELRTPLNAILGYAELLVDGVYGQLPDRPRGVLERIQNNGKHLLALINDVLDLAKIEAGQLTLTIEDYSLPEVVKSVVTATEPLAMSKGLKFIAALQSDMPTAHGDARRVSQVFLNLVGNAIKFTDQGEVEIRAAADKGQFVLTVRDTGPGIADTDQDRIFGEFQQIDDTNTRKKGGTGLGLAISKRMVEMQGGTISVESVLGQGSTFRVVLPVYVDEMLGEAAG